MKIQRLFVTQAAREYNFDKVKNNELKYEQIGILG